MTDEPTTAENVFEALDLPHHAKAAEIVKKQFGLFGFNLVLAPEKERAAVEVVAKALSEADARARGEERERCLQALSGEIKSITIGNVMIAKGITEEDAISLGNQFLIIARDAIRAEESGTFEESGATVDVTDVTELAAAHRAMIKAEKEIGD